MLPKKTSERKKTPPQAFKPRKIALNEQLQFGLASSASEKDVTSLLPMSLPSLSQPVRIKSFNVMNKVYSAVGTMRIRKEQFFMSNRDPLQQEQYT